VVLWQLPAAGGEKIGALKYRLFYGTAAGSCLMRHDNERGKGHHWNVLGTKQPYHFTDVETLVGDFLGEIEKIRKRQ